MTYNPAPEVTRAEKENIMRYQIIYIKLDGSAPYPFSTCTDSEEDARRKLDTLPLVLHSYE